MCLFITFFPFIPCFFIYVFFSFIQSHYLSRLPYLTSSFASFLTLSLPFSSLIYFFSYLPFLSNLFYFTLTLPPFLICFFFPFLFSFASFLTLYLPASSLTYFFSYLPCLSISYFPFFYLALLFFLYFILTLLSSSFFFSSLPPFLPYIDLSFLLPISSLTFHLYLTPPCLTLPLPPSFLTCLFFLPYLSPYLLFLPIFPASSPTCLAVRLTILRASPPHQPEP